MNAFACTSLRVFLVGLVPLALMCACAAGDGTHPREPQNLGGHWQRDAAASDDARAILASAFASAKERREGGGGGGKRGMGGGMGGGGMGGGGRRGPAAQGNGGRSNPEQMHSQLDRFVLPPQRLDVEQTAQDIHMTYDTDRLTRTLTPGTKSTIIDDHGSADVEPKWKGNTLTIRTTIGSRLTVEEEYGLSKDGAEMIETLKLSGGSMQAVTVKSVYRRMP